MARRTIAQQLASLASNSPTNLDTSHVALYSYAAAMDTSTQQLTIPPAESADTRPYPASGSCTTCRFR